MLIITSVHLAEMSRHCEGAYPDEGCGALVGRMDGERRIVEAILPLANETAQTKRNRFAIGARDLLTLSKRERETGQRTLGFFHSHPDHPPVPSETDRAAGWPEYSYPILSVVRGKTTSWTSWRLREDGSVYDGEVVEISE